MDVIGKLNKLRLERNLSVYRLAEISGLNQSTLANTFSRQTIPSIENLACICSAMGITMAQFFSDNEETVLLTKEEKEVFSNYKKLPQNIKDSIKDLINVVVENNKL